MGRIALAKDYDEEAVVLGTGYGDQFEGET
jgi:hypothetical protein